MIDLRENDTTVSPAVAAVRAKLMEGLAPVDAFAQALGKCERVVKSWLGKGMPHIRYGRTPYIVVDQARDWLINRKPPSQ
jgi:hypothetical protein